MAFGPNHPLAHQPNLGGAPAYYTEEKLNQVADDLEAWSKKKDSIWLYDFFDEQDIDPEYAYRLMKNHKRFFQAYKKAWKRQSRG